MMNYLALISMQPGVLHCQTFSPLEAAADDECFVSVDCRD